MKLFNFLLPGHKCTYGYLLPDTVERMPWSSDFEVKPDSKPPYVLITCSLDKVNESIAKVLNVARERKTFKVLSGWRNELYPIFGARGDLSMERSGSPLFGIVTLGVHMTVYTHTKEGMMIWVPRRAPTKQTYGNMLDNSVAGGITAGEAPLNSIIREASEEASLPEEIVRKGAKACGTVSYFHVRDSRAGGETGLLQPEIQYVYDLEVGNDITLKPSDEEVKEFYLWPVERVCKALENGEFKPNCALVLLDFFIRHGILIAENEKDYVEIVARLHRKLPFPLAYGKDGS